MIHFAVDLKLTQHCKSIIIQKKFKKSNFECREQTLLMLKKKNPFNS